MVNRFDVYLINLDDEPSEDPKNSRPGVVISPDELNQNLDHVIIAPIASTKAKYPTRVPTDFLNAERYVILDQPRTIARSRLVKKIGAIDEETRNAVTRILLEMFS